MRGMEAPVGVEVVVGGEGAEAEDGFGSFEAQQAPVMSRRSPMRWRQVPSTAPVAMGQPASSAVS